MGCGCKGSNTVKTTTVQTTVPAVPAANQTSTQTVPAVQPTR